MFVTGLSAFAMLILVGAAFGAAGARLRRRAPGAVLALWILVAPALAVLGTARVAAQESGFGYQPARTHPAWMAGLFTLWLLITFAPAARSLAWGHVRSTKAAAAHAAVLILPGFLLALLIALVIDLAGGNFLPPR